MTWVFPRQPPGPAGPAGAAGAAGATGATGAAGGSLIYRAGSSAIAGGGTTVTVAFASAMPDANYVVELTCDANTFGLGNSTGRYLDVGTKTVNGFDVTLRLGSGGGTGVAAAGGLPFDYLAAKISTSVGVVYNASAPRTLGTATLTTNDLLSQRLALHTAAASDTWTTPTAAAIVAAITGAAVGDCFDFLAVDNIAGGFVTLAGGVGVTLAGGGDLPPPPVGGTSASRLFRFRLTNVTGGAEAVTVY